MLFGGGRSGKTLLHVRNTVMRALKAPLSRHLVLRFRFNHVKAAVILDTFPKVMRECFPGVAADVSRTDWYARLPNGSEVDRKSTRLNSSHLVISYAVFCLKKK